MKRLLGVWVAVLSVTLLIPSSSQAVTGPTVRAHRGGLHANLIENTALNFRAAAAEGRLAWEADVRFTSSNVPVILHNANLGLFGCPTKNINVTTMAAARACVAPNGQHITTLYEMLTELKTSGANAWLELKTEPTSAQWTELDGRLSAYRSRIVLESFLPAALLAASSRGYTTALLSTKAAQPTSLPAGTDWFAPMWTAVTADQVTTMHAAGVRVAVWTVSTLDRSAVAEGVDEIISDDAMIPAGVLQ